MVQILKAVLQIIYQKTPSIPLVLKIAHFFLAYFPWTESVNIRIVHKKVVAHKIVYKICCYTSLRVAILEILWFQKLAKEKSYCTQEHTFPHYLPGSVLAEFL